MAASHQPFKRKWFTVSVLYWILLAQETYQLEIIKFDVPPARPNGSSVVLHCDYELRGGQLLYSAKFYKDYVEFYRFLPTDTPQGQPFKLDGIYLDTKRSNATHVTLYKTDLNSDGLYSCEVSTEAPSFVTRRNDKIMKIYVLPQEALRVSGHRDHYSVNEHVNIDCVSGRSWPQLQLDWYINERPAPRHFLTHFKASVEPNGLMTSKLSLNFVTTHNYFQFDSLRLACTARMVLTYDLVAYELLNDGLRKTSAHVSKQTKDLAQINGKDMPVISGMHDKYNVNETVRLNCTSPSERAQLAWYINGKKMNQTKLIMDNASKTLTLQTSFQMEKHHFQTEEVQLKCVSSFHKTIADFQEQVIVRMFNTQFGGASLASSATTTLSIYLKTKWLLTLIFTRILLNSHSFPT